MTTNPYQTTLEDYVAYNLHYVDTNTGLKKHNQRMRLLCCLLILVGGNIYVFVQGGFGVIPFVMYAILAAGMYYYLPKYQRMIIRRNIKRMLKNPANQNACDERTVTLDAQGMHVLGGGEDSNYDYATIQDMTVTDTHIFIYVGEMSAVIVPASAFDDAQARYAFVDRLRQNMQTAKETGELE